MNEVALLKSMKHPNILECFEWWLSDKVYVSSLLYRRLLSGGSATLQKTKSVVCATDSLISWDWGNGSFFACFFLLFEKDN
jgi:hypothetical protein